MSFRSLIKGMTLKMCMLCFVNKQHCSEMRNNEWLQNGELLVRDMSTSGGARTAHITDNAFLKRELFSVQSVK